MFKWRRYNRKNSKRRGVKPPKSVHDPFAQSIDWSPIKSKESTFATHELIEIDKTRLELRPSKASMFHVYAFAIVGICCAAFGLSQSVIADMPVVQTLVLPSTGFGMFLILASIYTAYHVTRPIIFDKTAGFYWRGTRQPSEVYDKSKILEWCRLSEVRALQIIPERIERKNTPYTSFELNLVLGDRHRINLVDHSDHKTILEQGKRLSDFLEVPVWDAS